MDATPRPDHGFLRLVGASERAALLALGRIARFQHGAVLMHEGDQGDRVMILLAGRAKVTRVGVDGHETLLSISDPGDLLGELSYIDGKRRSGTVTALEQVYVLVISSSVLRAHVERVPLVATAMLEVMAERFREATEWRSGFSTSDTLGRLAARLTELVDRYGVECDRGVEILIALSQEELTAWTAASRAGVAKALQTLRELGWIETRPRRIVVLNVDALRARAR